VDLPATVPMGEHELVPLNAGEHHQLEDAVSGMLRRSTGRGRGTTRCVPPSSRRSGEDFIDAFKPHAARSACATTRACRSASCRRPRCRRYTAYEEFIGATGQRAHARQPARLLQWPRVADLPAHQARAERLQAAQIAQAGVGKSRGPARDAATIFDENAALLVVRDGDAGGRALDELRAHCWARGLSTKRAMFGPMRRSGCSATR
jgi:hypothetical protein